MKKTHHKTSTFLFHSRRKPKGERERETHTLTLNRPPYPQDKEKAHGWVLVWPPAAVRMWSGVSLTPQGLLDLLQGVTALDSLSLHRRLAHTPLAHPRHVSIAGHIVWEWGIWEREKRRMLEYRAEELLKWEKRNFLFFGLASKSITFLHEWWHHWTEVTELKT